MDANEPGALWDRWRRANDDEALASLLETVEPELLRTARKYAPDDTTAHDLVQETWRAAITKAWDYDEAQPLVPWLVGFLIVETRRERRRAARFVDPDRLVQREVPEPVEAADLGELRATLLTSIDTLPERYRDVVRLSFEQGLEPSEIALELERTPGAVRVQLHRALAMLRRSLPKGFALGIAVMAASGSSKAAMRASMLDEAIGRGPEVIAQGVRLGKVGAGAGGAFAAWKVATLFLALIALAGVAWWAIPRDAAHVDANSLARAVAAPQAIPRGERETLAPSPSPTSARIAAAPAPVIAPPPIPSATAGGVFIEVDVLGIEPEAGETFDVALRAADIRVAPRAAQVAAAKHFELDLSDWYTPDAPRPREFFAVLDTPRFVVARKSVFVDADALAAAIAASARSSRCEIPVTIELAAAASRVTGRVIRSANASDASEYVGLYEMSRDGIPAPDPVESKPVDADGRFSLRARAAGPHVLVIVRPDARPRTEHLELTAGDVRALGDLALEAGESLSGIVRTAEGKPAIRAQLSIALPSKHAAWTMYAQPLAWTAGRFEHQGRNVSTDEHGLFFSSGLAPCAYKIAIASGPDASGIAAQLQLDDDGFLQASAPPDTRVEVVATATGLEFTLPGVRAILRVTSQGAPVARCDVLRLFAGGGFAGSATDDTGRIVLRASQPDAVDLRIDKLGFEPKTLHIEPKSLREGEVIEVELAPGQAPAHLSFEAGGVDLSRALFALTPLDELTPQDLASLAEHPAGVMTPGYVPTGVDEHGSLRQPIRAGRYKLLVRPSDEPSSSGPAQFLPTWFDLDVAAGETSTRHLELLFGGRIRFAPPRYTGASPTLAIRIENADGKVVTTQFTAQVLRTDSRQGRTRSTRLKVGASNETDVLLPGKYTLTIEAPDAEPKTLEVEVVSGKTTEVAIELKPR
jgi:RNA polymerase sigma-70 factor, ECF subfamily